MAGMQTDDDFIDEHPTFFTVLDAIVKYTFAAELFLRLVAEGKRVWCFFFESFHPLNLALWNIFDLIVVIIVLSADQSLGAVRLARLLRLLRVLYNLPPLQILVVGLMSSAKSILWVAVLLCILFYVFGVMGVTFFCEEDPRHFGSLGHAFLSLFRVATGDSWSAILYPLVFKCEDTSLKYPDCITFGDDSFLPILFFVFFILLSAVSALNLVIGVILNAMVEAQSARADPELKEDVAIFFEQLRKLVGAAAPDPVVPVPGPAHEFDQVVSSLDHTITTFHGMRENLEMLRFYLVPEAPQSSLEQLPMCVTQADTLSASELVRTGVERALAEGRVDPPYPRATTKIAAAYDLVAFRAFDVVSSRWFRWATTIVVMVAAVTQGLQASGCESKFEDASWTEPTEAIITTCFVLEVAVKVVAQGRRPWMFFFEQLHPDINFDQWNIFDLGIVVASLLEFQQASVIRLFRVFKIVVAFPDLQMLVLGFFMSIPSIFFILLILVLLFYSYAILGVTIFSDLDPVHFDNLGHAFLTLFQCCTGDSWASAVAAITFYGCGENLEQGYPRRHCDQSLEPAPWSTAMYFSSFVFLSMLVTLNLIIGTIDISMSRVRESRAKEERTMHELAMIEGNDDPRLNSLSRMQAPCDTHVMADVDPFVLQNMKQGITNLHNEIHRIELSLLQFKFMAVAAEEKARKARSLDSLRPSKVAPSPQKPEQANGGSHGHGHGHGEDSHEDSREEGHGDNGDGHGNGRVNGEEASMLSEMSEAVLLESRQEVLDGYETALSPGGVVPPLADLEGPRSTRTELVAQGSGIPVTSLTSVTGGGDKEPQRAAQEISRTATLPLSDGEDDMDVISLNAKAQPGR